MPVETLTSGIFKLRFKALGTECEVQFRTPSVEAAKEFRAAALAWLRNFEKTWSRFLPESLLCRINAEAGRNRIELTAEQEEVVRLCERTFRATDGLVDATSFSLTSLWDEAAKADRLPSEEEVGKTLRRVSWPSVEWGNGSVFFEESTTGNPANWTPVPEEQAVRTDTKIVLTTPRGPGQKLFRLKVVL